MSSPVQPSSPWNQAAVAPPQLRTLQTLQSLRSFCQRLTQGFSRTSGLRFQAKPRRLKLQETVQLGDKRFVAILSVDGNEFLLGCSSAGVSLLGQLRTDQVPAVAPSFTAILESHRMENLRTQGDPA